MNKVRKVNNCCCKYKSRSMSHYGSDLSKLKRKDRQMDSYRDRLIDKTLFKKKKNASLVQKRHVHISGMLDDLQ